MDTIQWERYPRVTQFSLSQSWIALQAKLGRAPNTIDAYGRALEDYFTFFSKYAIPLETASREHIANYIHDLLKRPNPKGKQAYVMHDGIGLSNATLQQRLTAVRLFYDYLIEEGIRQQNPVGRGRYTTRGGFGGRRNRSLVPKYEKLPWIPSEEQWQLIVQTARSEPIRNRLMLAFAYDAALRREELCSLSTQDIDPSQRLLRIRAETTKNRRERVVPYSQSTASLFQSYLQERRLLSTHRGPLFLSASRRNRTAPISIWTWSKVVEGISRRSGIEQFTTHTLRHLCLTDLARANWDLHEIALFAGHRNPQTTLLYIHLSGRDLKEKMVKGMAGIHAWRNKMMEGGLI